MKTTRRNLLKSLLCAAVVGASAAVGRKPERLMPPNARFVKIGLIGFSESEDYCEVYVSDEKGRSIREQVQYSDMPAFTPPYPSS